SDLPTTMPEALLAVPSLEQPPSVPRSCILPFCQRNAWPEAVVLDIPVTWPLSLMPRAVAMQPPGSVPRSVRVPFCHITARTQLFAAPFPTTTFVLLMALAALMPLRDRYVPDCNMKVSEPPFCVPTLPTSVPDALMPLKPAPHGAPWASCLSWSVSVPPDQVTA